MIDINNLPKRAYTGGGREVTICGVDLVKNLVFGYPVYYRFLGDALGDEEVDGDLQVYTPEVLFPDNAKAKEKVDQQVKEASEKLAALNEELRTIKSTLLDAKMANERLLKQATQWAGLEHLVNIVSGKELVVLEMTSSYGENIAYKIRPIEEALTYTEDSRSYRRQLKLLSLHGRTEGDLTWRLNRYTDDSGSNYTMVWFFATEDEAKQKAIQLLHESQDPEKAKGNNYHIAAASYLKSIASLGAEPLPGIKEAVREANRKSALVAVENQRKALEEAQRRLDQLVHAADTLQPAPPAPPFPPTLPAESTT